jgi:hypothetical protein
LEYEEFKKSLCIQNGTSVFSDSADDQVIESRASADAAPERTPAGKAKGERMTRISTLSIIGKLTGPPRYA